MNAADVLDKAADVIAERGWTQHVLIDDRDGSVCVMGGIRVACGYPLDSISDWQEAATHLRIATVDGPDGDLPDWNDAPGRTAVEVVTALRECAASLRAAS